MICFNSQVWSYFNSSSRPHQQTPESESALLISDSVLAVEATVSLTHGLHSHVPLCIPVERLHHSVAAEYKCTRLQ